jgi:ubiquinone/menaquinone biosynthesis C-methylase UbiE
MSWIAAAGAVDRSTWAASYDMFGRTVEPGGLILDLGCGAGFDAEGLQSRGFSLVGLDIVETLLKAANVRDAFVGRLVRADMMTLPFAAGSFEGVWADGSLHHLRKADLPTALTEIRRVLKPACALFVSVERGSSEGLASPDADVTGARYYARYEADELTAAIRLAGFDVVESVVNGPSDRSGGFVAACATRRVD